MRNVSLATSFTSVLVVLLFVSSQAPAAEKLSDILREHNWDGIIGTWVDADTNGKAYTASYVWRIKDRVIEVATKDKEMTTIGLMGVNAKTGEVFYMGADSTGGSSLGKWEVADNGDAVLGLVFTGGDGEQGTVGVRYQQQNTDTVIMTIELPEPIKIKLIRAKPKK